MKITRSHFKKLLAGSAIALGMSMVGGPQAEAAFRTAPLVISADVVAACTITAAGLNFGTYDVTALVADTTTGTVTVNCSTGAPVLVDLDEGAFAAGASTPAAPLRNMDAGTTTPLPYKLSSVSSGGAEWGAGDPLALGSGVPRSGTGADDVLTVFGQIDPGQLVLSGNYSDIVTATVTY